MTPEEARQLIRRLSFAIENVLDGSQRDNGWVDPHALNRLWEVYQTDVCPLGSDRIPTISAPPDLLAALETLVAAGRYAWTKPGNETLDYAEAERLAAAAIAKAKGV